MNELSTAWAIIQEARSEIVAMQPRQKTVFRAADFSLHRPETCEE
jgi:hypothetical protein